MRHMSVSGISAVGSTSVANVYATLSPYLNGVVRTSDAAQAAQVNAAANATSIAASATAIATRGDAAAAATASPPFVNPAIAAIGARIALGESLTPPAAVTPDALLGTTALTAANATATSPLALAAQAAETDTVLGTSTNLSNPFAVNPLVSTTTDTLTTNALTTAAATNALNATQTAPTSAFAQVAYGDAGELIQSYGAVALATGPQALAASAFAQPLTPIIPPAAIVSPVGATAAVA
jgi:hypothetical protein